MEAGKPLAGTGRRGSVIPVLILAAALQMPQGPYGDSATASLVARARERHHALDSAVHDYQATVRTTLDAAFARGRFARLLPIAVLEQVSRLWWQTPNDVKLETIGQRSRTVFRGANMDARWSRPWFIPRFLGDSIRLMGNDFPDRAAIHPLSEEGERVYRYAIDDSLELALPGRTVRAIGVRVTPTRAEGALVAGQLWLDARTAEVVRFRFTFVGRDLWSGRDSLKTRRDSAEERRDNDLANRVLRVSADLEYGLFGQRFWLPYRQSIVLDIELPWFGGLVVPVTFVSAFTDMRVNSGTPIVFTVPLPDSGASARVERGSRGAMKSASDEDARRQRRERRHEADSTREREGYTSADRWPGGRYEIVVPADSVLRRYDGWRDSLSLALTPADAQRLDDLRRDALALRGSLPPGLAGGSSPLLSIDRFADLMRYDRAEGLALGAGLSWPLGGPYVTLAARARYAFTDRRLQASVALRRDAIGGRTELVVFREMQDADPWARGLNPGNSFRALFLTHDEGSYVFAQGAEVARRFAYRNAADVSLSLRVARERAPNRLAHSGVNDFLGGRGDFAPLDPVLPGTFVTVGAGISGGLIPASWEVGTEATAGAGRREARLWAAASTVLRGPGELDVRVAGWAGAGVGDSLPQREFRLGGTRTLRGFEAGTFRGVSAYAASVDLTLRRPGISPLVFADVGEVAARGVEFRGDPTVSVGAGVSALAGLMRVHAARGLDAGARWRFDLVFGLLR
jgi:hypothetical protein